jgi:hypothetical protein
VSLKRFMILDPAECHFVYCHCDERHFVAC